MMPKTGEESSPTMVVFFENPILGMVIYSESDSFGTISTFDPDDFVDVDDGIIVWLTEGPKEPIYEAMEMVEKIRSLHDADTTEEVE